MSRTRENLSVVALATVAVLLAGCGGGSSSNGGIAHLGTAARSSATAGEGAASPGSGSPEAALLAFAKCMRSHGLPNFPDPSGGGFSFRRGAGIDPFSPAFKAGQAKCKKFQPSGGPGSGPPPSAQTVARFLKVAQCMRRHGVPEFPDPRTSVPSNLHPPAGAARFVISDIEGVILVMGSIDTQSPAFTHAAGVCAFPLHNH
ncbi:MAG: hypothetical protein ACRDLF_10390 [Solirubrobacteraceae bacterium]